MADEDVKVAGFASYGVNEPPTEEHLRLVNAHALPFTTMLMKQPSQVERDILGTVVVSIALNSGDPWGYLVGLVAACHEAIGKWADGDLQQLPPTN